MLNEITTEPLSVDRCLSAVGRPDCGGIAVFLGVVRDNSDDVPTDFLEYEAYEPMALDMVANIIDEARARWDVREVAMQHRTGRLEVGEASVVIAVSAPHRGPALEACQYIIDELKQRVPIWKKEHRPNGDVWVEGPTTPVAHTSASDS